jgi:hypothetical protein
MLNGSLLSRTLLTDRDYSQYSVDRQVYDKDWFPYTLIHKPNVPTEGDEANTNADYHTFKIIDIDERGNVIEKMTFVHALPPNMEVHFYFSNDLT